MKQKRKTTGYIKYITDHEFERIRDYIETKIESPPMKMCLRLMMFIGLAAGDVNDLKRENFNQDFTVVNFIRKKTQRPVERKLQKKLSRELKLYYEQHNHKMTDNYLFFTSYRNQSKNPFIMRNVISVKFAEIRKGLNINETYYTTKHGLNLHRLTSHTMRHYAAYRVYLASGKDIVATTRIFGWAKTETAARYIYSMEAKLREQQIIEKAFKI